MLLSALARSAAIEVHHEESDAIMSDFRIMFERLEALVSDSASGLVVCKPLCDSHWVDRILRHLDGSRAVWMFRNWSDVANSWIRKWPGHGLEIAERFRQGDERWLNWRAERIEPRTRASFLTLLESVADDASGVACFWWLRNQIFFDRDLHKHPDFVRPLCYEQLVGDPDRWLTRVSSFAGVGFDLEMLADVHARSIAINVVPEIPEPIATACDEALADLDRCAAAAWS